MGKTPSQNWSEAILKALALCQPATVGEIAATIKQKGLRTLTGATPEATINAQLYAQLQPSGAVASEGNRPTRWRLATPSTTTPSKRPAALAKLEPTQPQATEDAGGVKAFGMFWRRAWVDWRGAKPRLVGTAQGASQSVDFSEEVGVYILYDGAKAVYAGQAGNSDKSKGTNKSNATLGRRLLDHTRDRLSGRWDRFSWFGLYGVVQRDEQSPPHLEKTSAPLQANGLITTLESILMETLEPSLNRQGAQWDSLGAIEYLQKPREKSLAEELPKLMAYLHK
ncbi:hypothetical protein E3E12_05685 [Formicincola oecophyllae]|uniref:HTH HARE-type domain-containing protein n=1 Tax=Formicincola oecophyllae TaxID=2558361 RepID=A0A4Y6U8R6_9PROT|nr:winged helix-turn-helix domain-containing protein [Formicincola oecophyllae]QDH13762.1 hypothetical protein E3E12_05685 [Formicincola oecophyllae]